MTRPERSSYRVEQPVREERSVREARDYSRPERATREVYDQTRPERDQTRPERDQTRPERAARDARPDREGRRERFYGADESSAYGFNMPTQTDSPRGPIYSFALH